MRPGRLILAVVAASGCALAQFPLIGIIDFYGLRKVSADQVRSALGLREEDRPPKSIAGMKKRLEALPGVARAELDLVCCEQGKSILYVGIEEEGAPRIEFRPAPRSAVRLLAEIVETYERLGAALQKGVLKGDTAEDRSSGHSLSADPAARALQERFILQAASHLETLRDVLRNSADAKHRAIAAWVIGYAADKRQVVDDLVYAMRDPDGLVRNNATRALGPIAELANRSPQLGIHIPPEPFVEMLNSVVWTDRNKALWALTEVRRDMPAGKLAEMLAPARPSLVEMARWKSPGHAGPAQTLLERAAEAP